MEVDCNAFKKRFICAFQAVVKAVSYYIHVSFLKTGKGHKLYPAGLSISKKPFYWFCNRRFEGILEKDANMIWKNFPETLCIEICKRLNSTEAKFRTEIQQLQEGNTDYHFKD